MGYVEHIPPKLLTGAAGGNAPFRSLYLFQAERHGARRARLLRKGPERSANPDGEGQSGYLCRRQHSLVDKFFKQMEKYGFLRVITGLSGVSLD
ncbi:hypothetical protein HY11_10435 [Hyphomonas pacifica]|nr:hypothetical protein HY11_10435 [Hyphomonas pacifica]